MLTYDRPRSSNEVEKSIIARGTSSYGVRIYQAILTRLIRSKESLTTSSSLVKGPWIFHIISKKKCINGGAKVLVLGNGLALI